MRRSGRANISAETLGAAFRRWSCGLQQRQAAAEIGISVATYCNWETNRSEPDLRNIPAAIQFLGFDWRPQGKTLGARLRRARTAAGLSDNRIGRASRGRPKHRLRMGGGSTRPVDAILGET
jgi:DNA-binding XRE family transcriptional regulator